MTREELLALRPGTKLDFLVAEHVLGWERWDHWYDQARTRPLTEWIRSDRRQRATPCPKFSSDWGQALYLLENLNLDGDAGVTIHYAAYAEPAERFWVHIGNAHRHKAVAATLPEALCKAALLVKMDLAMTGGEAMGRE